MVSKHYRHYCILVGVRVVQKCKASLTHKYAVIVARIWDIFIQDSSRYFRKKWLYAPVFLFFQKSISRVCSHVIAVYSEKQAPALRYCLQEP